MSTVVDAVIAAAGTIGAVSFIAATGVIWRSGRRIKRMSDDWNGEAARPGVAERPGVMVRLSRIEGGQTYQGQVQAVQGQYLEQVWHELHPNSGLSMRDSVNRIHLATTGQPDPSAPTGVPIP